MDGTEPHSNDFFKETLDPFLGAGMTALVAGRLGRDCVGLED
jgi:hypothetical protein